MSNPQSAETDLIFKIMKEIMLQEKTIKSYTKEIYDKFCHKYYDQTYNKFAVFYYFYKRNYICQLNT